MDKSDHSCELCCDPGGTLLWEDAECRIVRVTDTDYPGFCRVIWKAHVREMTDLGLGERQSLMAVVFAVEEAIRSRFSPDKINLASFGNMTPHLHWHVIPRWIDDRHFPEPIWGNSHRTGLVHRPLVSDQDLIQAIMQRLSSGEAHG